MFTTWHLRPSRSTSVFMAPSPYIRLNQAGLDLRYQRLYLKKNRENKQAGLFYQDTKVVLSTCLKLKEQKQKQVECPHLPNMPVSLHLKMLPPCKGTERSVTISKAYWSWERFGSRLHAKRTSIVSTFQITETCLLASQATIQGGVCSCYP
jgi:hypothetical protein